ncbi:MAG: fluoride efflux transporter CrcB [Alphaproteobacteria bacterium]|nr:fluoride efflux transporter CrcB [Alphaproteobacteria bacterium]
MMNLLAVISGGALGSALRYGVGIFAPKLLGNAFPFATLIVNVLGCFLIGATIATFEARGPLDQTLRLFLTVGLLGGFTTFSAFSIDVLMLYDRKPLLAAVYIGVTLILSLGACAIGLRLYR